MSEPIPTAEATPQRARTLREQAATNLRLILIPLETLWNLARRYISPSYAECTDAANETRENGAFSLIFGHPPRSEGVSDLRKTSIAGAYRNLVTLAESGHAKELENLDCWQVVRVFIPALLRAGKPPSDLQTNRDCINWRLIWGQMVETIRSWQPVPDFKKLDREIVTFQARLEGRIPVPDVPLLPGLPSEATEQDTLEGVAAGRDQAGTEQRKEPDAIPDQSGRNTAEVDSVGPLERVGIVSVQLDSLISRIVSNPGEFRDWLNDAEELVQPLPDTADTHNSGELCRITECLRKLVLQRGDLATAKLVPRPGHSSSAPTHPEKEYILAIIRRLQAELNTEKPTAATSTPPAVGLERAEGAGAGRDQAGTGQGEGGKPKKPIEGNSPDPPKGKRGRRPATEAEKKKDMQIFDAWKSGNYRDYADLAKELGMRRKDVERAIDRHEKRIKPKE